MNLTKVWTERELEDLKALYENASWEELLDKIKRSKTAIKTRAERLGLQRMGNYWSDDNISRLKELYSQGLPHKEIASRLNRTKYSVESKMHQLQLGLGKSRLCDLTGMKFGLLTVLYRHSDNQGSFARWVCECECGIEVIINGNNLRQGITKSCGCIRMQTCGDNFRTHGMSYTPEYKFWKDAKRRAARYGRAFNITPSDIIIPEKCPILQIDIKISESGSPTDFSPSLDRVDSAKGYIKGNVKIISMRANRMKQDATLEDLERITQYIKQNT